MDESLGGGIQAGATAVGCLHSERAWLDDTCAVLGTSSQRNEALIATLRLVFLLPDRDRGSLLAQEIPHSAQAVHWRRLKLRWVQ